ncbi:glycosyltransferase family 2 protein [Mucilaginibacter sp. FT3.2]|uniref:glycosyltransferase family 2 protein n=1 Tax=Mucilaginibacter sp. FT3.2 TaxID=2723090 RepID=UPI00160A4954|nr:glycosyltransferase family 2 protein [Mucilaginibacter sp. FT3.2]MBB6233552.1 glycosyltransferase involved in cell wall biosynthesis [Mucilaginibacter sp. FT3.2]
MVPISVVIITQNEAEILAKSIPMLQQISNDIIVIDNGSTDETINIAQAFGCRVHQKSWSGYGANKNKGIQLARYNWILSIDGDEVPDETLLRSIAALKPDDERAVYDIQFKTYFGSKLIRFGNWGRDHHIRLFSRVHVKWNETPVHETLLLPKNAEVKKLEGCLHHYSVKNKQEHQAKTIHYAQLSAMKYLKIGRKANFVKLYLAPVFHFVKIYLFLLGFLDGKEGFIIARMAFINTWLKYHYLSKATETLGQKSVYQHDVSVMAYKFKTEARVE